jgi:hypothetical protein
MPLPKLSLPNGVTYGYDINGKRVCLGSQMGRGDTLPEDCDIPIKVRMEKLKFVDGAYDQWGAYWGAGNPIYCAWNKHENTLVFIRARNRREAKARVKEMLPQVKFYR